MTLRFEQRASHASVTAATGVAWRALDTDALLARLAARCRYDVRLASDAGDLVVVASVPEAPALAARRRTDLLAEALSVAAGFAPRPNAPLARSVIDGAFDLAAAAAAGLGWRTRRGADGALVLAPPHEDDALPVRVEPFADGILIARAIALPPDTVRSLPARRAVAHAVLALHAEVPGARLRACDPGRLRFVAEAHLPVAGADEDELAAVLESVRRAARLATPVLRCLRHTQVAEEYLAMQAPHPPGA